MLYQIQPEIRSKVYYFILLKFFLNGYLFLRERKREQVGEGQRQTHTESKAGSGLHAVSTEPDAGLEPTKYEIWSRMLNWLSHLGAPKAYSFKKRS